MNRYYKNEHTQSHILNLHFFSSRHLGRMSVRGLDPTCASSIKREPSSPSSQGDVSPAQPSPGSSSSDTNSSYGPLTKGHNHSNGLDSPGLYGHTAGLANNGETNRLVFTSWAPLFCAFHGTSNVKWTYNNYQTILLFFFSPSLASCFFFLATTIQEVWGGGRPSEVWIHAGLGGQASVSGVWRCSLGLPLWCGLLWGLQGLLQEDHSG